jgi:hypothetical protein
MVLAAGIVSQSALSRTLWKVQRSGLCSNEFALACGMYDC